MQILTLHFNSANNKTELTETFFSHFLIDDEKRCTRGKRGGAFIGYGTFQWSKAVQALSILILRSLINQNSLNTKGSPQQPILIGEASSLASSLDYAIDKQPNWIVDMFGCDSQGCSLIRRMILRSNPSRKYPGPVALSLNTAFIALDKIKIFHNSKPATKITELKGLERKLSMDTQFPMQKCTNLKEKDMLSVST